MSISKTLFAKVIGRQATVHGTSASVFFSHTGGERSIVVALRFFRSFFSGVEVPPPPRGLSPSQPLVFADPPVNAYRPIALPDETMNFRMAGNCYCDLETRFQESTMYAKYGYIAPRISRRVFPFFRNPEYEKIMISFDKKLDLLVFIRATLYIHVLKIFLKTFLTLIR